MNTHAPSPAKPKPQRRTLLMWGIPAAAVVIGGYFWLFGGRYIATEDAYIQQDMITVSSDISGRITSVNVTENQPVKQGQVLFMFDAVPYQLALQNAQAAVASATAEVAALKADFAQARADSRDATANLTLQQATYKRIAALAKADAASQSQLDTATYQLKAARQQLATARSKEAKALAALQGEPEIAPQDHALVLAAMARLGQAQVDLSHTVVIAPAPGIITQTNRLQVGQYVQPGTAVMALVKTGKTWVEANFKETDLTYMHPGQPATVTVDAYPDLALAGTVASMGAGTGAQFSLLPAQNATGNWVKVVQRVPVRLLLKNLPKGVTLQSGLSVKASVDTGHNHLYRYLHPAPHTATVAQQVSASWPVPRQL